MQTLLPWALVTRKVLKETAPRRELKEIVWLLEVRVCWEDEVGQVRQKDTRLCPQIKVHGEEGMDNVLQKKV